MRKYKKNIIVKARKFCFQKNFVILELENSVSGKSFLFFGLVWEVGQVATFYTTENLF